MDIKDRISRARTHLVIQKPFFGMIIMQVKFIEVPSGHGGICDTMGTDGKNVYYNPAFVDGLTDNEIKGVMAHEVMHIVLMHHIRMGDRDIRRWNIACDLAANPYIIDEFDLPGGRGNILCAENTDLSAEEIYEKMKDDPSMNKVDIDQYGWGMVVPYKGSGGEGEDEKEGKKDGPTRPSQCDIEKERRRVRAMTAAAKSGSRECGSTPAGLDRRIEEIHENRIDWTEVLRNFIDSAVSDDYTWIPPNRRFVHQDLYLPSVTSDSVARIAIAVDTSGSIDTKTLSMFNAEISYMIENCVSSVYVIHCDCGVAHTEEFQSYDYPVRINPRGGGGTSFVPPFRHIESEGMEKDISCMIYFTDGYCQDFPEKPSYPVLWAVYGMSEFESPFGIVLSVPEGE